jgi:hypothetical protein
VVWVLGVLAVLAVATSTALAVTVSPSAPTRSAAPGRQWLRGHALEVAVPRQRWRLEPATSAIRYSANALVRAPAVLDAGFCPSSTSSSRAFAGFLKAAPGTVPAVLNSQLGTWVAAIAGVAIPVPYVTGPRADFDVPVPAGPCAPTTAHLTLVGRATSAGVVLLVLVRDVGEPDDLTADAAEEIVASLRPIGS